MKEKDELLELIKKAGGRFNQNHTYHNGEISSTHVTIQPFTFRVVAPQLVKEQKKIAKAEEREKNPGFIRKLIQGEKQ